MLTEQAGGSVARRLTAGAVTLVLLTASLYSSGALRAAPKEQRLDAAKERLMELERDFELVVEKYNATREELIDIQAEMASTRLVVDELQDKMDRRRNDAVALATELYKSGSATAALESILSAESIAEVETRLTYLRSSENAQAQVFERLAVDQAALEGHLAALDEDRVRAMAAEERLTELRTSIEAKVADQQDEIQELNRQIAIAERRRQRRLAALAAADRAAAEAAAPSFISEPANPAPAPNPSAQTAVDSALSQTGKPYQWGAAGPDAYDCSGLTMWAWAQAGVSLPHNSGMQYSATPRVGRSDWAPGDLLFFGSPIHHVGMYIGNGQMVEAPYTGQFVRVVSANRSDFVGAGRPGV